MHVELYAQGGLNIIDVSMFSQVYVKRFYLLLYLIALRTLSLYHFQTIIYEYY